MYLIGVINFISTVLMQITTYETILIGRFLLGVTCGMYPMVVPVMTKELCPPSLKLILGSFYSLARIIGIIFCFSIGLILEIKNIPHYWRIVFVIPGIIVFIQTLLIYFFIPDIPEDLIKRGQVDKV